MQAANSRIIEAGAPFLRSKGGGRNHRAHAQDPFRTRRLVEDLSYGDFPSLSLCVWARARDYWPYPHSPNFFRDFWERIEGSRSY